MDCQECIHFFMYKNFLSRLVFVLGDRKKYPWGAHIGLDRGIIERLFNGKEAKGETLAHISRLENVSITWLLEGKGSPYLVNKCTSDDEAADYLGALLDEHGWTAYICETADRTALVLTLPASFETKKGEKINYTIVETITSPGPRSFNLLKMASIHTKGINLNKDSFNRLATGWMNNQELLELLSTAERISAGHFAQLTNATPAVSPLTDDQRLWSLLEIYRALSDDDRQRLLESAEHMAAELIVTELRAKQLQDITGSKSD